MKDSLENIGFDEWFLNQVPKEDVKDYEFARVMSVFKDIYTIALGETEIQGRLSGNFRYTAHSRKDFPVTGDWVCVELLDEGTHGIIHELFPRKTLLKRKTAGKTIDFQLIAANIDTAFIMQSLDYNLNISRLERYLVMVNESKITPAVLLSKSDLMSEEEILKVKSDIAAVAPEVRVFSFSNVTGNGISVLKDFLKKAHTYCLLGSSGVGKTTLLNSIMGKEKFATQNVSKIASKGKHTTTNRILVPLENGALLVDTPGMRELGNMSVDEGLDNTFSEITELALYCKFSNCSHTNEKGCAVIAAVDAEEISEKRYGNYLKMKREAEFNEMSYYEKRSKDRAFTKHVKGVMKSKRNKR